MSEAVRPYLWLTSGLPLAAAPPPEMPKGAGLDPALLWLIPGLPLAAAAIIAVLALVGPRRLRGQAHWVCAAAIAASCVLSLMAFLAVYNEAGHGEHSAPAWVQSG